MRLIKRFETFGMVFTFLLLMTSCAADLEQSVTGKLQITCTTTMISDLAHEIGGDHIVINGLMGAGVDPHLYKASEGDVNKLLNADLIFYNGLHLEGKLVEVFEKMNMGDSKTIALSDCLDKSQLIESELFASNYDPHIWFSIDHWESIASYMAEKLSNADPVNADEYEKNRKNYVLKLNELKKVVQNLIQTIPLENRILVTAHDAFSYFGKEFGFEVVGLQGLSTATEAGVRDMQNLATFIIEKKVNAVFVESSIPIRTIESLQAAVESQGHIVRIGGTLYSDALGSAGTVEGTYIGMYQYNVKTITNSLK